MQRALVCFSAIAKSVRFVWIWLSSFGENAVVMCLYNRCYVRRAAVTHLYCVVVKDLMQLRSLGKGFTIAFKNLLPTQVLTCLLYGGLNHNTFRDICLLRGLLVASFLSSRNSILSSDFCAVEAAHHYIKQASCCLFNPLASRVKQKRFSGVENDLFPVFIDLDSRLRDVQCSSEKLLGD